MLVGRFKPFIHVGWKAGAIVFRRVDCTDQAGPVWNALEKWLQEEDADGALMVSGNGAIVWGKSGNVVGAIPYAAQAGLANLLAKLARSCRSVLDQRSMSINN